MTYGSYYPPAQGVGMNPVAGAGFAMGAVMLGAAGLYVYAGRKAEHGLPTALLYLSAIGWGLSAATSLAGGALLSQDGV